MSTTPSHEELVTLVRLQQSRLNVLAVEAAAFRHRTTYLAGLLLLALAFVTTAASGEASQPAEGDFSATFFGLEAQMRRVGVSPDLDSVRQSLPAFVSMITVAAVGLAVVAFKQPDATSPRRLIALIVAVIGGLASCAYLFMTFEVGADLEPGVAPYLIVAGAAAMVRSMSFARPSVLA